MNKKKVIIIWIISILSIVIISFSIIGFGIYISSSLQRLYDFQDFIVWFASILLPNHVLEYEFAAIVVIVYILLMIYIIVYLISLMLICKSKGKNMSINYRKIQGVLALGLFVVGSINRLFEKEIFCSISIGITALYIIALIIEVIKYRKKIIGRSIISILALVLMLIVLFLPYRVQLIALFSSIFGPILYFTNLIIINLMKKLPIENTKTIKAIDEN